MINNIVVKNSFKESLLKQIKRGIILILAIKILLNAGALITAYFETGNEIASQDSFNKIPIELIITTPFISFIIFIILSVKLYKKFKQNEHINKTIISIIAILTTIIALMEYEKSHYYTQKYYNGGICGRSTVRWLHRLPGYSLNPAMEIQARDARQYFYGPHAFEEGTSYSPLDGHPESHARRSPDGADTTNTTQEVDAAVEEVEYQDGHAQ